MKPIFCCGFSQEIRPFCAALSHYGSVQLLEAWRGVGTKHSSDTLFTVIAADDLAAVADAAGILLLGSKMVRQTHPPGAGMLPVFDSENRAAADLLLSADCAAISCGMRAQDTLSISSYTPSGVSLSLQRSVRSLSGRQIEEHELFLPVFPKGTPFLAAALGAVLILSDAEASKNGRAHFCPLP